MAIIANEKKRKMKKISRVRKKVIGTPERPRVCFTQTNKHIYIQAVNDIEGKTLTFLSSLAKDLDIKSVARTSRKVAEILAEKFKEKLSTANISKIVFDKRDKKYHGVAKIFADKLREKGIQF